MKLQVLKRPQSGIQGNELEPSAIKIQKLVLASNQDVSIRDYLLCRQQSLCLHLNRFTPATINSRYQVDIVHMFTDLDLLKENQNKIDPKPISLDEVLSIIKSTPGCKVLIDGEGGIGKTTLLRYLAYNWAKKLDETFAGKIVFPINIRDIKKGEDALDVIVKQMKLKHFNLKTDLPENPKLIKRFIMNHDDEIVLLLDGLDELGIGNESPITLFKKEELENSTVILTSRSERIDEFIKESNVHVKVKGFNADSIKTYIEKHFQFFETTTLGESLIDELELNEEDEELRGYAHPEVYSMCRNPMLLLSVCIMWEETQHLPAEKTALFEEVFRSILNQYNRQENNQQNISKFKDTPKKFVDAMLVLGKCMYEGLKVNQIYINAKHLQGNSDMVALALKLGFVYKDEPTSKSDFEDIFTAPHKLIVEALVGFYFYKLSHETTGFKQMGVAKNTPGKLLHSLDDSEWQNIRESEYLNIARQFAIGFLGADANKFLNHWITNSFTTYRSLMTQLETVKEEHRARVEDALNDHLTKTDLAIKPHIDEVCSSLKILVHHMNSEVHVTEHDHFIKLIRKMHGIGPLQIGDYTITDALIKSCCNEKSKKKKGTMLAHTMIVVPNQNTLLEKIHETWNDEVIEHLIAECQKLNIKYDITSYSLYQSSIGSSYMAHLLSNAPNLKFLNLDASITSPVANNMIRECTNKGVTLSLNKVFIRDSNLSNIDGCSLASLFIVAPKLNHLCLIKCSLSGVIINEMVKELCSRGVSVILDALDISDNFLNDICGSALASFMLITPKLTHLDIHNCNLSGGIINDTTRSFSSRIGVILELTELDINDNNFSNINGSSFAYLMSIAPKLKHLNMENCSLSGDMMNVMTSYFCRKGVKLVLQKLVISGNNLSKVDGFSLASLISTAPKLTDLYLSNCSLPGVILNDMSRKYSSSGVKTEITFLYLDGNNFSTVCGASLACLLSTAFQTSNHLDINNCSISGDIMNDMIKELASKEIKLKLNHLNINGNCLSNIQGSSLASLLTIAPDIDMLYMSDSRLSGDILNDMIRQCITGDMLNLLYLDISGNDLSNINGCSLASLLVVAPKLKFLYISRCNLSGVIMNNMIIEYTSRGLKMTLESIGVSYNDLSNIDVLLLTSLMNIAPELYIIELHHCSIPDDVINDIKNEFSSRGVDLNLDDDNEDDVEGSDDNDFDNDGQFGLGCK